MISQTGYFAVVFTVGNNYVEVDFNTSAKKAELSAISTSILASFTAL